MTTAPEGNIDVIALEGTFDDAQAILKALFNDKIFRDDVGLTGVNSINWARVLAQIVYYFVSAVALTKGMLEGAIATDVRNAKLALTCVLHRLFRPGCSAPN